MSPAQTKQITEKIDRLEKKLDILIRHFIIHRTVDQPDWLEDPAATSHLKNLINESEADIAAGRVEKAEKVFAEKEKNKRMIFGEKNYAQH